MAKKKTPVLGEETIVGQLEPKDQEFARWIFNVARKMIRWAIHQGWVAVCPVCTRKVAVNDRALYSTLIEDLKKIAVLSESLPEGWVRIGSVYLRSREYKKLEMWGFIEEHEDSPGRKTKRSTKNDIWRVTPKGFAFLCKEIAVPSSYREVVGFDGGMFLGWSDKQVRVDEVDPKFEYERLRGGQ